MHATVDVDAAAAIVRISGRLTFAENGAFRQVVEDLEKAGGSHVVFDLSGVEFIDSAGLGLLLVARDLVAGRGGAIELHHAGGQVGRMLQLAQFGDFFTFSASCAQV